MGPISKKHFNIILGILSLAMAFVFTHTLFVAGVPDPFSGTLAFAFTYSSIEWEGGDNIGGFTSKAYLIINNEVLTFPTFNRNAATDSEMVELSGEYAMKEGKQAYEIYVSPRTFGAESESQGEIDGQSFMQKPTFFLPGTKTEVLAMARKLNNAKGIIIGKDPNTGNMIQFGDEDFPLNFKPRLAFGGTPTDRRGLFVECEGDSFNAALIYPGTLPLTPAAASS